MNENLDIFEEEDTQKGKYLTFTLEDENYGIDIMYVTEIVGLQAITAVPELPNFIRGIINLRGKIIPVMDARIRFRKEEIEYNDRTCIIVIDVKELLVGVIVDAVSEVVNIDEKDIVPPPMIGSVGRKFIKAVGKSNDQVTLILDCEMILDEAELKEIVSADV